MKRIGYVLLIAALFCGRVAVCVASTDFSQKSLENEVITFFDDDDSVSLLTLYSVFKKHGENIDKQDGFLIWHSEKYGNMLLEPISGDAVDRISIGALYTVKNEYLDSELLKGLVDATNKKNNLYNYSIGGTGLLVRGNVFYANNTLEIGLLIDCMELHNDISLSMLGLIDENFLSYFE